MADATPRWVKVFGVIAVVVFVLFVALHLFGGGPALHMQHGRL
jgi:hypothetical protein